MGQAHSVFHHESPIDESGEVRAQKNQLGKEDGKKQKISIREPLEGWTNDDSNKFEIISPSSDISNPSLFRHRHNNALSGKYGTHNKIKVNARVSRVQTTRNRTSKVCSKQDPVVVTKTGIDRIPPPASFYYQPEKEQHMKVNDDQNNLNRRHSIEANILKKNCNQNHDQINTWMLKCMIWKAKCIRAKQHLADCWPNDEANDKGVKLQRTFDQRDSLSTNKHDDVGNILEKRSVQDPAGPSAYLQLEQTNFQPVWKEHTVDAKVSNIHGNKNSKLNTKDEHTRKNNITPYYLHSESDYVNRIALQDPKSNNKESSFQENNENGQEEEETEHDLPSTPVQALFDADNGMPFKLMVGERKAAVHHSNLKNDSKSKLILADTPDPRYLREKERLSTVQIVDKKPLVVQVSLKNRETGGESQEKSSTRTSIEEKVQRQIDSQANLLDQSVLVDSVLSNDIDPPCDRQNIIRRKQHLNVDQGDKHLGPNERRRTHDSGEFHQAPGHPIVIPTNPIEPLTEKHSNKGLLSKKVKTPELGSCKVKLQLADKTTRIQENALVSESENSPKAKGVDVSRKQNRCSLPPNNFRRSSTASIASMLQQSFITKYLSTDVSSDDSSGDDDKLVGTRTTILATLQSDKQSQIPKTPSSSGDTKCLYGACHLSPAESVESMSSNSSKPMFSDQVMPNAAFLFSPSYDGGIVQQRRTVLSGDVSVADSTGFSISTFGSRSRLSLSRSKPVSIPIRSTHSLEDGRQENLRVRFSQSNKVVLSVQEIPRWSLEEQRNHSVIPDIESKLSDLTDSSEVIQKDKHRISSGHLTKSTLRLPSLNPIDEIIDGSRIADAADEQTGELPQIFEKNNLVKSEFDMQDEKHIVSEQLGLLSSMSLEDSLQIFEDNCEQDENTPEVEHKMRWSYRNDNGLIVGVTPLLGSKTTLHATNSPYIRFQAAKSKFSRKSVDSSNKNNTNNLKKESPIKRRSSPIKKKSGSLVNTRIAAMEAFQLHQKDRVHERSSLLSVNSDMGPLVGKLTNVQTSIPERCSLCSNDDKELDSKVDTNTIRRLSTTEHVVSDQQCNTAYKGRSSETSLSQCTESRSYGDVFGQIMDPSTYDEGTDVDLYHDPVSHLFQSSHTENLKENASDDDPFDEFLRDEDNESASYVENGSVATIRQERRGSNMSENFNFQRHSIGDSSTVFTSTSNTCDGSVATIRQQRQSSDHSTVSGVSQMQKAIISFRGEAHVKPSELRNAVLMGSISATHGTTIQARKWRDLAAAAHEKDLAGKVKSSKKTNRQSLSERNPNTLWR